MPQTVDQVMNNEVSATHKLNDRITTEQIQVLENIYSQQEAVERSSGSRH